MDGRWRFDSLAQLASSVGRDPSKIGGGVAKDLRYVEKTWQRIKAVLADAEAREIREEPVRRWLRELRDLSYDAEDLLDLHEYQTIAKQVEACRHTSSRKRKATASPPADATFGKEMARGVEGIRKRLEAIAEKRKDLRLISTDTPKSLPESSPLAEIPDIFVGREDITEELLGVLLSEGCCDAVEVIAVVGMGGVGKTRLCQHVYKNRERMGGRFDLSSWVHVGETLDVVRLMEAVADSFASGGSVYLSGLQQGVLDAVHGKRILLVLDDAWSRSVHDWDTIRAPFVAGARKGSKILITTRSEEVAGIAGATGLIRLGCLSDEDGWFLFSHHALGSGKPPPEELVQVGKAILERCGGLPLAIKIVGSLLRSKGDDTQSWKLILDSDLWNFGLDGDEEGRSNLLGSLYLSYIHLPSHLKPCFRLCSLFKGQAIRIQDLVGLWMAHNLIRDEGEIPLESVANRHINELVSRSFFVRDFAQEDFDPGDVEVTRTHLPNTEVIVMHDLIEDVAVYASRDECFVNPPWNSPVGARHWTVNLHGHSDRVHLKDSGLRTLRILVLTDDSLIGAVQFQFSQIKNLRFLEVNDQFTHIIGLGNRFHILKHLRVLSIQDYDMEVIPESLYSLYNLRHLDLSQCHIKAVPNLIGNLKNLRYLNLSRTRISRIPEAIFTLDHLRVLALQFLPIDKLSESISRLTTLLELNLSLCEKLIELPIGVTDLTNLQSLDISNTGISHMPAGLSRLTKLTYLPYFPLGLNGEHAELQVLKNLYLRNTLHIDYLGSVRREEDAREVNMVHKLHVSKLVLAFWQHSSSKATDLDEEVSMRHEKILHHLKPHTDINELIIEGYQGVKLPLWTGDQSYDNLVELSLWTLKLCKSLSPLHQLPSLDYLFLHCMLSLAVLVPEQAHLCTTSIDQDAYLVQEKGMFFPKLTILHIQMCESMEFLPLYKFTALKELKACTCRTLKDIQFADPASMEGHGGEVASSLKYVKFEDCPQLCFSEITTLPRSLEKLSVHASENLKNWCERNKASKLLHVTTISLK